MDVVCRECKAETFYITYDERGATVYCSECNHFEVWHDAR